jgi:hypothetical protein
MLALLTSNLPRVSYAYNPKVYWEGMIDATYAWRQAFRRQLVAALAAWEEEVVVVTVVVVVVVVVVVAAAAAAAAVAAARGAA